MITIITTSLIAHGMCGYYEGRAQTTMRAHGVCGYYKGRTQTAMINLQLKNLWKTRRERENWLRFDKFLSHISVYALLSSYLQPYVSWREQAQNIESIALIIYRRISYPLTQSIKILEILWYFWYDAFCFHVS